MLKQLRPAVVSFALLTLVTGVAYPLLVTGVSRVLFESQSRGSVIDIDHRGVGSELIAQSFTSPRYFWPRPSAANYDAAAGAGSNLGPSNPALVEAVNGRLATLRTADVTAAVPVDLVTASGSGLDPHISPQAAEVQVARVAAARQVPEAIVRKAVAECTAGRTLGILGEPRVNVLRLNLLLDRGPSVTHAVGTSDVAGWRARAFMLDVK